MTPPAFPGLARIEITAIVLVVTFVLAKVLPWLVGRLSGRMHGNIRTLLHLTVIGAIWVTGLSTALSALGVPIVAALGVTVVGAAVGAATLQLGQGIVGGAWLLLEGDFDIGDSLDVGQYLGATLVAIRLRSLVLMTTEADGSHKIVVVPSQLLMANSFAKVVPRDGKLPFGVEEDSVVEGWLRTVAKATTRYKNGPPHTPAP